MIQVLHTIILAALALAAITIAVMGLIALTLIVIDAVRRPELPQKRRRQRYFPEDKPESIRLFRK